VLRSLRVFAIVAAIALTGVAIARSAGISGAAGQQKRISPHESITGTGVQPVGLSSKQRS